MDEPELIESIRALTPMLEDNARQAEKDRKPVDSVMIAIEKTQAYRWFVPKKYGGFEFSLEGFMEVGMMLGAADISTAWAITFCMEHNWLWAYTMPKVKRLYSAKTLTSLLLELWLQKAPPDQSIKAIS